MTPYTCSAVRTARYVQHASENVSVRARPLVVGQNPLGRLMLRCGGVFAFGKRIINRKDLRRVQLS